MTFNSELLSLASEAEIVLSDIFKKIDETSFENTSKVLNAFHKNKVSDTVFSGTSGYGYDDKGRDTLDKIYAQVFESEAAFVRHNIVSGTHALSIGLYGLLRPNDIMLSITGKPYDTLEEVIGIGKNGDQNNGSLRDFGVTYKQIDLLQDGTIDFNSVDKFISEYGERIKVIFIQRSKGYMNRPTLNIAQIGDIVKFVKTRATTAYTVVDNCYGEFVESHEPTAVGVDMIIGSLIKNPGGGMAESGGYIAGTQRAVELASYRLTSVGVGLECGASLGQNKSIYKGLFFAPHVVAQAIKTAIFAAYIFEKLGYEVSPKWNDSRSDIIQTVKFGNPQGLIAFCKGIQCGSPIDSFVTPEPWNMPGYTDQVIMAAGTFTQGASIELSADGPIREPYTAFFQGGLTFESGKIGILSASTHVLEMNKVSIGNNFGMKRDL